jgi:hypothetical protein
MALDGYITIKIYDAGITKMCYSLERLDRLKLDLLKEGGCKVEVSGGNIYI